jgi:hypothetical protein
MRAYLNPSTEEDMYNIELANGMKIHYLSASTVKWTTLDPCTSLNMVTVNRYLSNFYLKHDEIILY